MEGQRYYIDKTFKEGQFRIGILVQTNSLGSDQNCILKLQATKFKKYKWCRQNSVGWLLENKNKVKIALWEFRVFSSKPGITWNSKFEFK